MLCLYGQYEDTVQNVHVYLIRDKSFLYALSNGQSLCSINKILILFYYYYYYLHIITSSLHKSFSPRATHFRTRHLVIHSNMFILVRNNRSYNSCSVFVLQSRALIRPCLGECGKMNFNQPSLVEIRFEAQRNKGDLKNSQIYPYSRNYARAIDYLWRLEVSKGFLIMCLGLFAMTY